MAASSITILSSCLLSTEGDGARAESFGGVGEASFLNIQCSSITPFFELWAVPQSTKLKIYQALISCGVQTNALCLR